MKLSAGRRRSAKETPTWLIVQNWTTFWSDSVFLFQIDNVPRKNIWSPSTTPRPYALIHKPVSPIMSLSQQARIDSMLLDDDEFNYDDNDQDDDQDDDDQESKRDTQEPNTHQHDDDSSASDSDDTGESDKSGGDESEEDPMEGIPSSTQKIVRNNSLNGMGGRSGRGYMKSVLNSEIQRVGGVTGGNSGNSIGIATSTEGAAVYILQRKRDAMNCYLRTCCMRLAGEIMMSSEGDLLLPQ